MAFLVPAVLAFCSDSVVLCFLSTKTTTKDVEQEHWVYHTQYLTTLAIVRLVLLCLPLLFHSYTGTALRCHRWYVVFYLCSTLFIIFHMVGLALMNPFSFLEYSLFWYKLLLGLTASICHLLIVFHVRSTAPVPPQNNQLRFLPSTMYFAVRSASDNNDNATFHWNEFLVDMQGRWLQTRNEWRVKLEELNARLTPEITPFRILLLLFAHEDVWENRLIERLDDASLIFYAPQLVSFLLHGALYNSPILEEWVLNKCRSNVFFAHRVYWFLRSWCLKQPANRRGSRQLLLDEPSSPEQTFKCFHNDSLFPEERIMIERLMDQISRCGEESSVRSVHIPVPPALPVALIQAAEANRIPVHPGTGIPSIRHFESLQTNYFGESDSNMFDQTPTFLDALITLAENLFQVPPNERKEILRQQLKTLECELLPSEHIYIPLTHMNHKVWRIVSDESIPISTKERVPLIVYLEVLDFDVRTLHGDQKIVHDWRFGVRSPYRRGSLLSKVKVPFDTLKTHVRELVRDRVSSEGDELPLLVDRKSESSTMSVVEAAPPSVCLSRVSSTGSLVSMGQWSSPVKKNDTPPENHHIGGDPRTLQDVKVCLDDTSTTACTTTNRNESPLPYGSDQENEKDEENANKPLKPPPIVFRESWQSKQERVRRKSAFGEHPGWRLMPILIKANDDLRQEQLAAQLIYRMAVILAREKISVWLCPYEILALTDRGGIIEAIPDTISLDSLKKNSTSISSLLGFFHSHFGSEEELFAAKANFVESLAAYSIVCFLLQIKDRHNGNILIDNTGHLIHIDFGFFFLSSPGKNAGFESAPFKLTRDMVEVLEGPDSHLFQTFRHLCIKTFIALRRNCMEIILLVEMLKNGNEDLQCFRNQPDVAIAGLRERFRLDLNDRACKEYVNSLVDDSIENWRTDWYDRYQRYFVGVL